MYTFCGNISFHLLWVFIREHGCWIVWHKMFSFARHFQIVFQSGCTFAFSLAVNENFYCFSFAPAFDVVSVLEFSHSSSCVLVSHFHFTGDIKCGVSFHICFLLLVVFFFCHLCIFGDVFVKVFSTFIIF